MIFPKNTKQERERGPAGRSHRGWSVPASREVRPAEAELALSEVLPFRVRTSLSLGRCMQSRHHQHRQETEHVRHSQRSLCHLQPVPSPTSRELSAFGPWSFSFPQIHKWHQAPCYLRVWHNASESHPRYCVHP